MQKLGPNLFQGIIWAPRVSDEEYQRYVAGVGSYLPEGTVCPRCKGVGQLSYRTGVTSWDCRPCECKTQSLRRAQQLYSGLSLPMPHQTFDTFRPTLESKEALAAAQEFADHPTDYSILTIRGSVGTGKTHLLQAIGWASLEAGRQPKFISVARYLERLRSTYSDDSPVSFETLYRPLEAAAILLLDDLGAERMTNWGQEQLYKIVNHRYQERLPVAASMNLDAGRAVDQYGERTADRLFDTGSGRVKVVSTGQKSYRTGQ